MEIKSYLKQVLTVKQNLFDTVTRMYGSVAPTLRITLIFHGIYRSIFSLEKGAVKIQIKKTDDRRRY